MSQSKHVLKEPITPEARGIAVKVLGDIFSQLGELSSQSNKILENLEEALYNRYGQHPKEYLRRIAILEVFLNPQGPVGQFARFFRNKALQGVYFPERLIELDIVDMLPEVFINPASDDSQKKKLRSGIEDYIDQKTVRQTQAFNAKLNPGGSIPTQPTRPVFLKLTGESVSIPSLCANPYWETKEVNTIICKENGAFYCLDIEKLLEQIADTGTAVNVYTNNELDPEIVENLKKRYAVEIQAIEQGEPISLGSRTPEELEDLARTLDQLQEFHSVLNQDSVLEAISDFGLESIEDPDVGGTQKLLKVLPEMIISKFEATDDSQDAIDALNDWLEDSIASIKDTIAASQPVEVQAELEDIIEPVETAVQEPVETAVQEPVETVEKKIDEAEVVKEKVLGEGTVASQIYNNYINLVEVYRDAILEDLKKASTMSQRKELTDKLRKIYEQLRSLQIAAKTFGGIIDLLQQALSFYTQRLKEHDKAVGMGLVYGQASQAERKQIAGQVLNISEEINFIEGLRDKFFEELGKS